MGLSLVIPGVTFTNYIDRSLPYASSAVGYYLFGTDEATTENNLAPGATTDMTANGTPTYGAGYAEMDSTTDYFATGLGLTLDQTVIVVSQINDNTEYFFTTTGLIMRGNGVGNIRLDGSTGGVCTQAFNPGTAYAFMAGTAAGTTGTPIKMYTGASGTLTETVSAANLAAPITAGNAVLGPSGAPAGGGTYRMAAAMVFESQLNASQLDEIYEYFRFALPKRGITVF